MITKVLFIGLGGIGQRHLRNILKLRPDIQIYALRQRREQIVLDDKLHCIEGETLESKYNIHTVTTIKEAEKAGVNTVFICTPSSMHIDYAIQCISLGWNTFVEKPLSHNMDRANELADILKNNYCQTTMIGFQNRFHPCIKKAKSFLEQNLLGDICYVNAEIGENVTKWHPYEDYRRMYACKSELGGGVVLSQIHELDYLYSFFGLPETIYASGGKLSDLEMDVEDVADILMQFSLSSKKVPVHIHEDYLQIPASRKCKIQGTKGLLMFDLLTSVINVYDMQGQNIYHEQFSFDRNDMFVEELKNFIDSAESRSSSLIPIEEGLSSLKIAVNAKISMKTGSVINL
ncbi:MAG: Gfo/Idh/MocA family oxidoreductase [Dorea sp.]|jgi:predicted dehydrogenase|nr:Gfo/Idh/MocA family oxidoreductase [Dorea sp.]